MKSLVVLAAALLFFGANIARSQPVSVSVSNFPTIAQLEAGWNAAFTNLLTIQYGVAPAITSTTTYQGIGGYLYVVSHFTAGLTSGSVLGVAFDPTTATPLGSGAFAVEAANGFECYQSEGFCGCTAEQIRTAAGDIIRRCLCDGGSRRRPYIVSFSAILEEFS